MQVDNQEDDDVMTGHPPEADVVRAVVVTVTVMVPGAAGKCTSIRCSADDSAVLHVGFYTHSVCEAPVCDACVSSACSCRYSILLVCRLALFLSNRTRGVVAR